MAVRAFDRLAPRYDALWTKSAVGRSQREAVWRWLDPLIRPASKILDLGCGTGEDALWMKTLGAQVYAIDASAEMVRIARRRGVNACRLPLEAVRHLNGGFDGALSNFGVFNCIAEFAPIARELARLIRPGGFLAICTMGQCCAWETCHFVRRGEFKKAFRRWRRKGSDSSIGVRVCYPSVKRLTQSFRPAFKLERWTGVGVFVPPSYVDGLTANRITRLAQIDERLAHWPLLRAVSDHRLLLFTRL